MVRVSFFLTGPPLCFMLCLAIAGRREKKMIDFRILSPMEKVFLDNTNFIYALANDNANIGNIRETFFYNQTRLTQDVTSSKVSDFSIGKFTFEVGGAKKSHRQVKDVENSFIVRDDIEYASGDIIPLWGFGLMY